MRHAFLIGGVERLLWLSRRPDGHVLDLDGRKYDVSLDDRGRLIIDGETTQTWIAVDGDRIHVHLDGEAHELIYRDPVARYAQSRDGLGERVLRAPMPGVVVALPVTVGQSVAAGDTLVVIESMKLETAIRGSRDGVVETLHVSIGQGFDRDAPLVTLAEV